MDVDELISTWDDRRKASEERFKTFFPETDDELAIVLRGHLLVEEGIDRLNRHCFHFPEFYDKCDLNFYKKLLIARAQVITPYPSQDMFFDSIEKLNQLRNKLAHDLEPDLIRQKSNSFLMLTEGMYHTSAMDSVKESDYPARLRGAIAYILGQLEIIDYFVEFMEKSRKYGGNLDDE